MTQNNTQRGRNQLKAWDAAKPTNFFTADNNLQRTLKRYLGEQYGAVQQRLTALGAASATALDTLAKVEDRVGNHPRLERWDGLGQRIEQIEFHPNHDAAGKLIWESGVMAIQGEAGHTVEQMAMIYLLGHNGEAGHMCSLACTSGLIKALQVAADDAIRDRFLPPLLNPDYDAMHHGAQFLTEVQGGSDVGANAVIATPQADGTWRISGEKWFCSNINADQFLMTARASDADGTPGLGLFVVPRLLDDGTTNGFYMRRLKDKLGTRTLASAELDFENAVAYPVGAVERGFKTVVELVLNTSRLFNAVSCAGVIQRAYIEASQYACHREAFGNAIASYPMVQEAIADLASTAQAAIASSFYLAHLLDKIETGQANDDDRAVYRLLVNVNKMITSVQGTNMVHRAIEVLGGNGAIESFSILPRLYRDMVVLESWEGTHNVLCLQVLRDIARYGIHEPFARDLETQLSAINHPTLTPMLTHVRRALHQAMNMLSRIERHGQPYAQAHARRWVEAITAVAQAVYLLTEAQWELDNDLNTIKPDLLRHFVNQHCRPDYDPLEDSDYLNRLERIITSV